MTPYNEIFQLHEQGLNNFQIEKELKNVSSKTIITVLKLANEYGFQYSSSSPMSDTDIHRLLQPKKI